MMDNFNLNDLIQFAGLIAVVGSFTWALKAKLDVMMVLITTMKEEMKDQRLALQAMATKDYTDKELSHLRHRVEKIEGVMERRRAPNGSEEG